MPPPELKANRVKQRSRAGLDGRLEQHLRAYETVAACTAKVSHSLVASAPIVAAGLGLLAVPHPAMAGVVCTAVKKSVHGSRGHLLLDLNNDGINDVSVSAYSTFIIGSDGNFFRSDFLSARGLMPGNEIAADKKRYAFAGESGQKLGSSVGFYNSAVMGRHVSNLSGAANYGQWRNLRSPRFLGVKFLISGETHFGWIRFASAITGRIVGARATVSGYAYETLPNQPIRVGLCNNGASAYEPGMEPAPGSLGQLAAGAAGR